MIQALKLSHMNRLYSGGIIMETCNKRFFLGANTPQGFYSLFDELYSAKNGWNLYIIKGGPGTGKSSFIKKTAESIEEAGYEVERIHCSSDPSSLDAIIIPQLKVSVADGTAPHVLEPKYPGAVEEIINLGECWDSGKLKANSAKIIELTDTNSACHRRCIRFLEAAASLKGDVRRIAYAHTDEEKIDRYASRIASREFGSPRGRVGRESRRFVSAVTPIGIDTFYDTFEKLCDNIMVVEDEYSAASVLLADKLRSYALGLGLDVISCLCPLAPSLGAEHIIIPEIRFAVFTSNSYHDDQFLNAKTIHAARFMDTNGLRESRHRIAFNKKTQGELIDESIEALINAKHIHDELEKYYISSMDFERVMKKSEELSSKILEKRPTEA
jgi:hypothetical protein